MVKTPKPKAVKTNDKLDPKQFCLTKKVNGMWLPLTQEELQQTIN